MAFRIDRTMAALEVGLDGVAERQRAIAHNIANVSTPGFRSRRVSFEDSLASAIERGRRPESVRVSTGASDAPVNPRDGNNVVLEEEITSGIRANLQFEALTAAVNHKINIVRAAVAR